MKLNQLCILVEVRRNPNLNKKINSAQRLIELYNNDPDPSSLFVTFTNVNKLGINPSSEFSTPNGIYSYRLSYIVENLDDDHLLNARPFPEYIVDNVIVFRVIDNSKIFNVSDKLTQTSINNIIKLAESSVEYKEIFSSIINNNQTYKDVWVAVYRHIKSDKHFNEDKPRTIQHKNVNVDLEARLALKLFRKLNIDGFIDDGRSVIHENEPNQAVFFNSRVLKIVDHLKDQEKDNDQLRGDVPIASKEQIISFLDDGNLFRFSASQKAKLIRSIYARKIKKWIIANIHDIYNDVRFLKSILNVYIYTELEQGLIDGAKHLSDDQKEILCHHIDVLLPYGTASVPLMNQIKGQNP